MVKFQKKKGKNELNIVMNNKDNLLGQSTTMSAESLNNKEVLNN